MDKLTEIEERLKEIQTVEIYKEGADLEALEVEVRSLQEERKDMQIKIEKRKELLDGITSGKTARVVQTFEERGTPNMNYEENTTDLEVRSFQKFIAGQARNMSDVELRAINVAGAAAEVPVSIMGQLISSEKFSDLLHRATIFHESHAGKLYIPIASNTAANWKTENVDYDTVITASYEASPTLTKLELGGYELYRWMRMSSAAFSLATSDFTNQMLGLLQAEVVETLEKAFISGTGTGQPKGLDNLTYTTSENQILATASADTISAIDLAQGVSLLPQKYARGSIILMNSATACDVSQFKGTTEYAFDLSNGATMFLGHPIVISEHMADDVAYICDPKELYVRFAMPLQVEANRSSGFTEASTDLRALTVVDAVWNPKAVVKVGIASE